MVSTVKKNSEELSNLLKEKYLINKNVSKHLTKEQKEEILHILQDNGAVLALVKAFNAKNNELSNNNRKFGKQREDVRKELKIENEKNEELANEISQLRLQVKELKKKIVEILDSFHSQLVKNMLKRSEIIFFTKKLIQSLNNENI